MKSAVYAFASYREERERGDRERLVSRACDILVRSSPDRLPEALRIQSTIEVTITTATSDATRDGFRREVG